MYKYEEEINARIKEFNWTEEYEAIFNICKDDKISLTLVFSEFRTPLNSNARIALNKHYTYDKTGIYRREDNTLPVLEMPVAKTNALPHDSGNYFLGMIGVNPDNKKYYMVKVGGASDIRNRVSQYASYNPMLFVGTYIITENYLWTEENCHKYLEKHAYARAQNAKEWYYVDEETYFKLCDIFSNKTQFAIIAAGAAD